MKALRFQAAQMRPESAFLKGLVAAQVPRPLPGLIRDPAHPAPPSLQLTLCHDTARPAQPEQIRHRIHLNWLANRVSRVRI
jgi:hypothetical protein